MNWQQRLRDMVMAGGAGTLATIGCADRSPDLRPPPDGAGVDAGSVQDAGMSDAPIGAQPDVSFCCNASSDPCCPSSYCGAPVTTECTVKMACEAAGGTWDYGPGGATLGCGRPSDAGPADAGPADAGPTEAGPTDASPTDAQPDAFVDPFCCNANIDPCCPSIYCGKTATQDCTDKMACESGGGIWHYPGCVQDAGTHDAASDAP